MPRKKLTELTAARVAPPKSGRLELWDTALPSFGLRVTDKGAKSWILFTRVNGAMKRYTLGKHPVLRVAEAREKARDMLREIEAGRPPIVSRRDPEDDTVAAVLAQFIERHQKPRNRSWKEVERVLKRELAGWMDRPIQDITRRDVIEALDRVVDRGSPVMANRLLAHVRKLFNWALERGIVDASPVANVKAPGKETSRDRVLEDDELAAIWRASEAIGWPFGPIVRLLITTGQRRDEVAHLAWPDLDVDRRTWTLPRELTKADRAHTVPLSDVALEIIETLPQIGDGLVFPARRHGSTHPVSGFSKAKGKLDEISGVTDWKLHDLRRTAASGMARLGHAPHVVAAILNHSPSSTQGITAIYNRHRYGDEKRAALDAWSREVERIIGRGEAKVVALTAAR